jgi:glycosyltransferase involved in cell wall biosynthesis
MRFHVVALPHTQTAVSHSACAFTMKILHFCQMMSSLGHEVYHYGVEGSTVQDCCTEDVTLLSKAEQEGFFGRYNPDALYEVDWSGRASYWQLTNERAAIEINKRKRCGDFVCVIAGSINIPLANAVGTDVMVVEYGIGYNGTFAKYRVFESYAHMHKIWAAQGGFDPDGTFYDAVVPNYLNPGDYPFQATKGDYYLYLGRLIKRKGIHIAVETCKRLGVKLKIAGQGCVKVEGNRIHCADGEVYGGDNLEYVGFATGDKRAQLYQNAIATFVATTYLEPFGAVAIESQMAGTPAITTDFGAFPETVEHGKTGFRCRTLNEFVQAAKAASTLDAQYIHDRAVENYSMDAVRWRYETYFRQLQDLWGEGWYSLRAEPDAHWLKGYRNGD